MARVSKAPPGALWVAPPTAFREARAAPVSDPLCTFCRRVLTGDGLVVVYRHTARGDLVIAHYRCAPKPGLDGSPGG